MWVNVPGLILLVTLCSLAGMVVYAEYRRCDPLATDRIHANDQVMVCDLFQNSEMFGAGTALQRHLVT